MSRWPDPDDHGHSDDCPRHPKSARPKKYPCPYCDARAHPGGHVPITDTVILDWYAMTPPEIRKHNPSLLAYAERLIAERED